jgi:hypothetical protein
MCAFSEALMRANLSIMIKVLFIEKESERVEIVSKSIKKRC